VYHGLAAEGYTVIERARPRSRRVETSTSVNHGGVAVVAVSGIRLSAVDVGPQPTSFEPLSPFFTDPARLMSPPTFSPVYRLPGSAASVC